MRPLLVDRVVPVSATPVVHGSHRACEAALGCGLAHDRIALPRPHPVMGEAEEVECRALPAPCATGWSSTASPAPSSIAIRRKHVAQRAAQLKLHSQLDAGTAAELGDPLIQLFDELIGKADTALQACLASDPELARRAASIRSIPGFGPAKAAVAAASRAAASIRATCSTWPPLRQSASIPRCKLSSSASAPAASSTRSPSCAS